MRKHFLFLSSFAGIILLIFTVSSIVIISKNINGKFLGANVLQGATNSSGKDAAAAPDLTIADVLQKFQDQIQSLHDQLADLGSVVETVNLRNIFKRDLKFGDKGNDVSKLQELLIQYPDLYSSDTFKIDSATGLYDSNTRNIVKDFQSSTGLQETGIFDTATREKFYETVDELSQANPSVDFEPMDISSIPELNNKDSSSSDTADLKDKVSQLSSDVEEEKIEIVSLQNQLMSSSSSAPEIPPSPIVDTTPTTTPDSTTAPAPDSTTVSTPDSTATPIPTPTTTPTTPASTTSPTTVTSPPPKLTISNTQVTQVFQRSATVTWTTNVSSTSEVDYSTDMTLPANRTVVVNGLTTAGNHSIGLKNLISSTKYYYRVVSKDSTNTTANTAVQNFSTLH